MSKAKDMIYCFLEEKLKTLETKKNTCKALNYTHNEEKHDLFDYRISLIFISF